MAVGESELDVGIGLVVAQQDVEARLALLDEVVFECEGFVLVGDGDVFEVDGLAHERAGFGVGLRGREEVAAHAGAQVLRLADVDDLALGVLVEVAAGAGGQGADFLVEIHCGRKFKCRAGRGADGGFGFRRAGGRGVRGPQSSKLEDVTSGDQIDMERQSGTAAALGRAAAIMAKLRAPGGCPWDREQTFDTIKRHTLEETYEVFDAIERRDWPALKDELGDLLLQVLFYAEMAEEAGYFTLRDVAENLSEKLIRRHPHVFGEVEAEDADAVLRNWEQIKAEEKRAANKVERPESMLDDVPRTMPAMLEAAKLGSKAAKVGFDWPSVDGLFDKLAEETAELQAELAAKLQRRASRAGDGRSAVYRR